MKTMSLRALAREAPSLEEVTLITHEGSVIGRFVPLNAVESVTLSEGVRGTDDMAGAWSRSQPVPKTGKAKKS